MSRRTNRQRNDRHDQKVEICDSAELLKQILRQKRQHCVLRRDDPVLLEPWPAFLLFGIVELLSVAADVHSDCVICHADAVTLKSSPSLRGFSEKKIMPIAIAR